MNALTVLAEEHRAIDGMLGVLAEVVTRLERPAEVPRAVVDGTLSFLQTVADGVHHAKEERVLFPLLARHEFGPDQPFVNALMEHHDMGRAYVRRMKELWADARQDRPGAREALIAQARGYMELMREHIRIEDEFLETVSRDHLTQQDHAELSEGFDRVDEEKRLIGWVRQCREDVADFHERLARSA